MSMDEQIALTAAQIEEVENEVKETEKDWKEEQDPECKSFLGRQLESLWSKGALLRREEAQLRDKKAQLRDEKAQLREKEVLLLKAAQLRHEEALLLKSKDASDDRVADSGSGESVLSVAFEQPFVGQGVDKLLGILKAVNKYGPANWYAPFVVAINSSGWGKSRTFCELTSKGIWVIYCSMTMAGYTYPVASHISGYLHSEIKDRLRMRPNDNNVYYGQYRVMQLMMTFYAAALTVLSDWIEAARHSATPLEAVTFVKWLRSPEKHRQAWHYWAAVETLMKGRAVPMPATDPSLPHVGKTALASMAPVNPPVIVPSVEADVWAAWELEKDYILQKMTGELCPELQPTPGCELKVLYVFDEAKWLTKKIRDASVPPFVPVRRSVRYLPAGMVAAFVSTNSQVGNFAPPAEADESDRVSGRGTSVPHPVYGVYTVHRPSTRCSGKEARDPVRLIQIGRSLFRATYEASVKIKAASRESHVEKIITYAATKLLGGAGKLTEWEQEKAISKAAAIAVAGFRVALAINPVCQLATEVSAAHMVSVLGVSSCRRYVWTGWFMEPVLAEAAARIMSADKWGGMCKILSTVETAMKRQWVDVGYTGELAGRLLLLRAMDMSRDVPGNDVFPRCSLDEFIGNLAGKRLSDIADGKIDEELLGGTVSFNFWFKPDCARLTPEVLLEAFLANAGIVCMENTWRIDFVVPIYLGSLDTQEEITPKQMTAAFVQIRNVTGTDSKLSYSTAEATPMHARVTGWTKRPFLSLYINVSKESTKAPMSFQTGAEILTKVLGKASTKISREKLKALIDVYPESVAAKNSGSSATRQAMAMKASDVEKLDEDEKAKVRKLRVVKADVYNSWMAWFKFGEGQYALTIPSPPEHTGGDNVAAQLLKQVYDIAKVAGPDRKLMCKGDYPEQMDFEEQRSLKGDYREQMDFEEQRSLKRNYLEQMDFEEQKNLKGDYPEHMDFEEQRSGQRCQDQEEPLMLEDSD